MVTNTGVIQAIYTTETNPDDEKTAIVTFWMTGGQKIGQLIVPLKDSAQPTENPINDQ